MTDGRSAGLELPAVGLGTGRNVDPEQCAESVRTALEVGYRLVDTAERYGNERAVGAGIAAADVPREEVLLATKVLHPDNCETADPDAVVDHVRGSLDRLGVDSVDLLYFHWPDDYDLADAFEGFDRLYEAGAFDHLAVSNFTPDLLDEARELAAQPIVAVQAELHPLLHQEDLRAYCEAAGLAFVAYAPLMRGRITGVPEVVAIAEKHGTSPAQVSLAWIHSTGAIPIPKATGEAHLRENLAAPELVLDAEDVEAIEAIDREYRVADPPYAPW